MDAQQVLERIRDALTALTRYRSQHLENARIEEIMTQLEFVQSKVEASAVLTRAEKDSLDFNLIEGLPFEADGQLVNELYSIKNFALNTL